MSRKSKFLIGCDPEFFLHHKEKGFVNPSYYGFPGTKDAPYRIFGAGAIQIDGMAIEFNIYPTLYASDFNYHIARVLRSLHAIKRRNKDHSLLKFVMEPVAEFDPEYFKTVPDLNKELGCLPDYDMYGKIKKIPDFAADNPFRTAAGHIHIGYDQHLPVDEGTNNFKDAMYVAQEFHKSGIFAPKTEAEKKRLSLYGGDGAFRPKPYGVELRSPSNLWIKTKESRIKMFNDVCDVLEKLA